MGMIKQESVKIGEKEYIRTYSTAGKLLLDKEGAEYSEALDVEKKEYTEGDYINKDRASDVMFNLTKDVLQQIMDLVGVTAKKVIIKIDAVKDILDYYEVKYD